MRRCHDCAWWTVQPDWKLTAKQQLMHDKHYFWVEQCQTCGAMIAFDKGYYRGIELYSLDKPRKPNRLAHLQERMKDILGTRLVYNYETKITRYKHSNVSFLFDIYAPELSMVIDYRSLEYSYPIYAMDGDKDKARRYLAKLQKEATEKKEFCRQNSLKLVAVSFRVRLASKFPDLEALLKRSL